MHRAGTNNEIELKTFRTLVNVIRFFRTSLSAITPTMQIKDEPFLLSKCHLLTR